MTVVFGALTTQFTNYGLALAESTSSPEAMARLEEVKASLFREVNKDVLYLVYIGELGAWSVATTATNFPSLLFQVSECVSPSLHRRMQLGADPPARRPSSSRRHLHLHGDLCIHGRMQHKADTDSLSTSCTEAGDQLV